MGTVLGTNNILSIGFPGTGKTTFLAALYHVVGSEDVDGSLTLERIYEGHREHIVARQQEWLAFERVARTRNDLPEPIVLSLRSSEGQTLRFSIPDLSGETFRAQFEDRRWTKDFLAMVESAEALMFFVNPMQIRDPVTIADALPAVEELCQARGQSEEVSNEEAHGDGHPETKHAGDGSDDDFDIKNCCTQVKYVDLLQFVVDHLPTTPVRVAVVVSALDTLGAPPVESAPEDFVRERLALLDQYLRSNSDQISSRIYGVSAQGAEYDEEGRAELYSLDKAGDRVLVLANGVESSDITRPLKWLAFGEE